MNRRRVGIITGAAVVIAGVVARRFRTRTDPGPDLAVDMVPSGQRPDMGRVDDRSPGAGVEASAAPTSEPAVAGAGPVDVDVSSSDAVGLDVDGSSLDAGSVDVDVSSLDAGLAGVDGSSLDAGLAGVDVSSLDAGSADVDGSSLDAAALQLADSATGESSLGVPEILIPAIGAEPDQTTPDTSATPHDASPPIVLPTMPRAGSRDVANPVVTVPSADGGVPADVVSPAQSFVPAVAAAQSPTENTGAKPPQFERANAEPAPETAAAGGPGGGASTEPVASTGEGAVGDGSKPRRGGWRIFSGIMGALVVAALIAAMTIRLPYYRLEPGSVYDTIERVEAPTDLVSIPGGEIGFVTVSQTANITPLEWLDAQLDDSVRIRHEDEIRGDQTADELREADLRRMQISKNAAVVVALRKLGFDLVVTPVGVEVASVFDCTAADGTLGTGDLIVGVNGVDVRDGESLVEELIGVGVGQDVELLVERIDPDNPTQSIRTELVGLTLGSADDECLPADVRAEEPRPFIGIGTLTIVEEEFPVDVDIRTGRVSGPSAGLAFTLAIIDVLSEGELTNGLNIVATGTIDREGNVGPVGGIHQKTIAAERSGADVFIVPKCCQNFVDSETNEPIELPSNYEEALEHADDMLVIGVDTLDEALIAIGELGGDVEQFLPS